MYWGYPPAAEAFVENGSSVGSNPAQQFKFAGSGADFTICNVLEGAMIVLALGGPKSKRRGQRITPPSPCLLIREWREVGQTGRKQRLFSSVQRSNSFLA